MLPAVFGLSGSVLNDAERAFFRDANPLGFILFARNVDNRTQLRALTDDLRALSGRDDLLILVDQEGGRVARLAPPAWPAYPPAGDMAKLWYEDAELAQRVVAINYEALALDLVEAGINVTCAPVLDVVSEVTHEVIGDRAFGADPIQVARLGRACLDGLALGGVAGVIKHIPGHGRANLDSHHLLPVVHASDRMMDDDLLPFTRLADAPIAMTAHIQYEVWDSEHCATLSETIIRDVIRARIGFDGLLLTDDLDMKALSGSIPELAAASLQAGCDVALNCWGRMEDMEGIAAALSPAGEDCRRRLANAARGLRVYPENVNIRQRQAELIARRDDLLGQA